MARKKFETALLITGDSRGAVKATKLTEKELGKLEKRQLKGGKVAKQYSGSIGNITKNLIAYTGVATAAASVVLFPSFAIQRAKEFEKNLIGVGKTTNITGTELQAMGADIDELSKRMPVSVDNMLALAQSAGQLGVKGSDNIVKFTETMAKLERTTDIAGDQGAQSIARILNVTGEGIDTVDKFGSVIVALGNNSAATEGQIVRITTEVARSAAQFGIGSTEAAAMGAAMASLGVRAEAGGSAIGRTFQTINDIVQKGGDELDAFGRKFGFAGDEFAKAFAEDKVAAFNMFLEGVANQGANAGTALDSIGLGGQEIAKVIPVIAQNLDQYVAAQMLANEEAENGTALNKEFEVALESLDAQWVIFKNNVDSIARDMASDFLPALTDVFKSINEFVTDGGLDDLKLQLQAAAESFDRTWGDPTRTLIEDFSETYERQMRALGSFTRVTVSFIEDAFFNLPANIKSALQIIGIEAAALTDRIKTGFDNQVERNRRIAEAQLLFQERGTPRDIQQEIISQIQNTEFSRTQEQISQDRITALNKVFDERKREQEAFEARLEELRNDALLKPIEVQAERIKEEGDLIANVAKEQAKLTDDQAKSFEKLQDRLFPIEKLTKQYREEQELLNKALEAGKITQTEFDRSMGRLKETFEVAKTKASELGNEADPLAREFERAVDRIDDAFFNLFRSAFDDFGSFKDAMVDSAKDLAAQMAFQFTKQQFGFSSGNIAASFGGQAAASAAGGVGSGLLLGGAGSIASRFLPSGLGSIGGTGILGSIGSTFGFAQSTAAPLSGGLVSDLGGTLIDPATGLPISGSPGAGGFNFGQAATGIGASIAGGFAGNKLGSAIFGKQADNPAFTTAGSVIGGFFGPIGAGVGSFVGGLLDSLFGSKQKDPRFNIAPVTDPAREAFERNDLFKVVESALGNISFVTDKNFFPEGRNETGDRIIATLDAIAQLENTIAQQVGPDTTARIRESVASQDRLLRKNTLDFSPFIAERFGIIFDEIGGEVDAAFDRLTRGLSSTEVIGSLEQITSAAFQLGEISDSIDVDIVEKTITALDELENRQSDVVRQFDVTTEHLQQVASEFDHSTESIGNLSVALQNQRAAAAQLVTAFVNVERATDQTIGGAIDSIRQSLLSDEEIFNLRRDKIGDLTEELRSATDPARINNLVSQITDLSQTAFRSLGSGQQETLAGEFIEFLEQARSIAKERIEVGLDDISARQAGTRDLVNSELDLATTVVDPDDFNFEDFVPDFGPFQGAVDQFRGGASQIQAAADALSNNTGVDAQTTQQLLNTLQNIDDKLANSDRLNALLASFNPEVNA